MNPDSLSVCVSVCLCFFFSLQKKGIHQQRAIDLCRKSKVTLRDMHNAHVLYSGKIKVLSLLTLQNGASSVRS